MKEAKRIGRLSHCGQSAGRPYLHEAQRVYEAMRTEKEKSLPDESIVRAAKVALKAGRLTDGVAELLIDRVLVFADNRIEIRWKPAGFMCCVE